MKDIAVIRFGIVETVIRGDAPDESPQQLINGGATLVPEDEIPEGTVLPTERPPSIDETLARGYLDGPTGWRIKATHEDQATYGKLLAMLNTQAMLLGIGAVSAQTFLDQDGVPRTLPAPQFLALMLRYGAWCAAVMYPTIRS